MLEITPKPITMHKISDVVHILCLSVTDICQKNQTFSTSEISITFIKFVDQYWLGKWNWKYEYLTEVR